MNYLITIVLQKEKLRTDYNPQIQEVNQEVLEIKEQISNLELKLIDTGIDVGTFQFIYKDIRY